MADIKILNHVRICLLDIMLIVNPELTNKTKNSKQTNSVLVYL